MLKRLLWERPLRALVTIVLNAASVLGSQHVADVELTTNGQTMLTPDQMKVVSADSDKKAHSNWCAVNFSPYGECDCEDTDNG